MASRHKLCCGPCGHHRLQVCWCTAGDFLYTRFFAIGLFRLLELTKAKDPKALEALVKSMNVSIESVNRDLTTYKVSLALLARPSQHHSCLALARGTLAACMQARHPAVASTPCTP